MIAIRSTHYLMIPSNHHPYSYPTSNVFLTLSPSRRTTPVQKALEYAHTCSGQRIEIEKMSEEMKM